MATGEVVIPKEAVSAILEILETAGHLFTQWSPQPSPRSTDGVRAALSNFGTTLAKALDPLPSSPSPAPMTKDQGRQIQAALLAISMLPVLSVSLEEQGPPAELLQLSAPASQLGQMLDDWIELGR